MDDITPKNRSGKMIAIIVVVAVLALVGFAVMSRQQTSTPQETTETTAPPKTDEEIQVREIKITNQGLAFNPKEIRVKKGETVKIEFTAQGGMHDWVVDEFDAATEQVPAGENAEVTFTADKTGEFEYYCSVGNHRAEGMVGTLIVE